MSEKNNCRQKKFDNYRSIMLWKTGQELHKVSRDFNDENNSIF